MCSREELERIASAVVDSAYRVHSALGPGLLESAYATCHAYELRGRGLQVRCQVRLPVKYRELEIDAGYRLDLLVGEAVVVENKVVRALEPIHMAQLLTYLRLSGHRIGFLINWNTTRIRDGIRRLVNQL